jgi:hypothetical protein
MRLRSEKLRIATWRKSKAPCENVVGVRLDGPGDEVGVATAWRPSRSMPVKNRAV